MSALRGHVYLGRQSQSPPAGVEPKIKCALCGKAFSTGAGAAAHERNYHKKAIRRLMKDQAKGP